MGIFTMHFVGSSSDLNIESVSFDGFLRRLKNALFLSLLSNKIIITKRSFNDGKIKAENHFISLIDEVDNDDILFIFINKKSVKMITRLKNYCTKKNKKYVYFCEADFEGKSIDELIKNLTSFLECIPNGLILDNIDYIFSFCSALDDVLFGGMLAESEDAKIYRHTQNVFCHYKTYDYLSETYDYLSKWVNEQQVESSIRSSDLKCYIAKLPRKRRIRRERRSRDLKLDIVSFSAVFPNKINNGGRSLISILMYKDKYKYIVEREKNAFGEDSRKVDSGIFKVSKKTKVKVVLQSSDVKINDNECEQIWFGKYQKYQFDFEVPEDYKKREILFTAFVSFNGVPATRLKFLVNCENRNSVDLERNDIKSAFMSYASEDRDKVTLIIQGLKKARADLNVFFDVESLRSGELWQQKLCEEIDRRDILFLCWSHNAKESDWVRFEWQYAYETKGIDSIEPIPLERPENCPPPDVLAKKHFNDKLLFFR